MKSFLIPALLAASVSLLAIPDVEAQPSKKGGSAPAGAADTTGTEGPAITLTDLKPGTAVRVKFHNEWVDGKVVEASESGSSIRVQIGGNKEYFEPEKVWGTLEQRDNTAAGGYLDPGTRSGFEAFKAAVIEAERLKKSGASADELYEAVEKAEQILTQDYGKAGRHPRIGPFLARYWAMATVKVDRLAAAAVAEADKAVEKADYNYFAGFTYSTWGRAEEALNEYKAFQTTPNAETARLDQVLADARTKIDADWAKIKEMALAAARVPKEVYKGADARALKAKVTAAWKKNFPKRPILKLVISTQWDHERTWKTNASSAGGYWYDYTTIYMDLVVKKDATTATAYPVGITYKDGNKKTMVVSATDEGYGNYRPFDLLLKNVK